MSAPRISSRDRAASRLRLIAVTGTAGKTTTAWLAASVLAEAGFRVGVASDLGCIDADGALANPLDQRRPEALGAWVARVAAGGCTHAVVEVSADLLEAGALARGSCAAVVVTGFPRAARHAGPSRDALSRRILGTLAPAGCLVAACGRGSDRLLAAVARRGGISCLTAGLDGASDVNARPVERGLHGQTVLASAAGQVVPLAIDVPVASFVRNALCAAAVGLCHGVPLDIAARGIEAAGCVAGRVERLDRGQDFAAFLDAPRTRGALASTLASLRRLTPGRLAVVAEQRLVDRMGASAFAGPVRRRCDDAVVVPSDVLDEEADAAASAAYARVDRLLGRLGSGDCLVVLGGAGLPGGPRHGGGVPLATLVDGWLRLAHPPRSLSAGRRRAA